MPGVAFPPVGPVGRGSPPSPVLCAAKTTPCPSRVASLVARFPIPRLLHDVRGVPIWAHDLGEAPRSRQGFWSPGPPFRELCVETGGSPKFPSYPSADMPRSQTPVVSCALAAVAHRIAAFRRMQTVGFCLDTAEAILVTTTLHISGLNDAACLLAPSSFVRPLLGWHVEFAPDLLARRSSGGICIFIRTHWVTSTNFMRSLSIPRFRAYLGTSTP